LLIHYQKKPIAYGLQPKAAKAAAGYLISISKKPILPTAYSPKQPTQQQDTLLLLVKSLLPTAYSLRQEQQQQGTLALL
jgi:hypothetical protein